MVSILIGMHLGEEVLGHMATLCVTFLGTAKVFSKMAASFYIPKAVYKGSNLSTSPLALIAISLLSIVILVGEK
jgi:hypothetical protein